MSMWKTPRVAKTLKLVFALIVLEITSVIGIGSMVGVETWKSAALSAGMAIVTVSGMLASAFLKDGILSDDEIQDVFTKVAEKKAK